MYKFSLSDVLNPIRLRDLLNKFISDTSNDKRLSEIEKRIKVLEDKA